MDSNKELVGYLKACAYVKTPAVEKAFLKVDRKKFVPAEQAGSAYEDSPLPTAEGQTISAPGVVALMTEALELKPGMKVLEVGSGSGYQTAILAQIVGEKGKVYSVERIGELCEYAKKNLAKLGLKNVQAICGDGSRGLPREAPFDRIIVTAAAKKIPEKLVEQLKEGGRLVIPVGASAYLQELILLRKKAGGKTEQNSLLPVVFVPLVEGE